MSAAAKFRGCFRPRNLLMIALLLVAGTVSGQEVRKAIPVLPPCSVELQPYAAPIPSRPWALPGPDDPFFDGVNEFIIRQEEGYAPYIRVYRRGVFVGYGEIDPEEPYPAEPDNLVTI